MIRNAIHGAKARRSLKNDKALPSFRPACSVATRVTKAQIFSDWTHLRPEPMGRQCRWWRYDAAADQALQSPNLRGPAILRYASWAAAFPISQGGPITLR